MSLSANSLINGLTMLRAYDASVQVLMDDGGIRSSGPAPEAMHPQDVDRMKYEGWVYDLMDPSEPAYPSTNPWLLRSEE